MIGCLCISRLSVSFLYVPISLFDCNRPEKCTRSRKDPRKIRRWEHEDEIDAMHQQLKEASDTPLISQANGRTSVWHHKDVDGRYSLSN